MQLNTSTKHIAKLHPEKPHDIPANFFMVYKWKCMRCHHYIPFDRASLPCPAMEKK